MRNLAASLLAVACAAANAVPIAGQGTWESTLHARDIDSDGTADAFYDSDLNVTWLADANYALTSGFWATTGTLSYKEPGQLAPSEAEAWAPTLNIKGISGWRLPTTANWMPDGCGNAEPRIQPGSYCAITPDPSVNELAHLYTVTLGNVTKLKPMNTGDFANAWLDGWYYSGVYTGPVAQGRADVVFGWQYGTTGIQIAHMEYVPAYAWLLHDGDILPPTTPVPEPSETALLALGLLALAIRARRTSRRTHMSAEPCSVGMVAIGCCLNLPDGKQMQL